MSPAPPVHLNGKTRELLRLMASDPVMRSALGDLASNQMLHLSRLDPEDWQNLEDKYR